MLLSQTNLAAVEFAPTDSESFSILSMDGAVLGRGLVEVCGQGLRLQHIFPSGAVAAAYFVREDRQFQLLSPTNSTVVIQVVNCAWTNGERVCDFTVPATESGESGDIDWILLTEQTEMAHGMRS